MPTVIDVALEAGVSQTTVSRVINNSYLVSEEKRKRVLDAMKKLGYEIPERKKVKLANDAKTLLAITSICQFSLFDSMQRTANSLGYNLVFAHTGARSGAVCETMDLIRQLSKNGMLAGIFLVGFMDKENTEFINFIQSFPVVQILEEVNLDSNWSVSTDDFQAAYDAVKYLYENGYKRIRLCIDSTKSTVLRAESRRIEGFYSAMSDFKLEIADQLPVSEGFFENSNAEVLGNLRKSLLSPEERPDALFCINDTIACELLRFFYENDLRAPDDIAIICIEDTDLINSFANYLNMVIHDREEIGKESINLMHSILNGTVNSSRRVLIAPKCITKASFRRDKSI